MSAALHLANSEDLPKLLALVTACHTEAGYDTTDEARQRGLAPLLEGSPHGAVYLIGPARAPLGYIVVTFGWSITLGGLDGTLDEIYVRPAVRGRGVATEVITAIAAMLGSVGIKALHLEVTPATETALGLYTRCHFNPCDGTRLMSRIL